jgi:hypothetical protein
VIKLSYHEWFDNVRPKLLKEFGPRIAISYVCKRELGFTVRDHKGWVDNLNYDKEMRELEQNLSNEWLIVPPPKGQYDKMICLDFYDDKAETFFRLRYLHT